MPEYDFSRVSPTALFPVIARGEYTDIPFARQMLDYLRRQAPFPDEPPDSMRSYAPFFEARFKSVSRILTGLGATQILELASGLSPRGMDFARRGALYVEADLPEMTRRKRAVVIALLGSVPPNLQLCPASVLDSRQLASACSSFGPQPVAVTTEGLLRYLTFPEKIQLAENVTAILQQYGGVWITPDIHLKQWMPDRADSGFHQRLVDRIGRDIDANYFDSLAHARSFFEGCGFAVEERPLLEGIRDSVVSLPHASASLLDQLEQRRTFVLSLRTDSAPRPAGS